MNLVKRGILNYLKPRVRGELQPVYSDPGASFKAVIDFEMGLSEPQVATPSVPDNVVGVSQAAGVKIQHAFIGSCASGMLEDLRAAGMILKGRHVHTGVRLYVTPATKNVAVEASAEGLLKSFIQSGALVTPPGCGVCVGGRIGPVASGEVSINTATRNDQGRLGSMDAKLYIASPATVAASAVAGEITDPRSFL